MKTRALLSVTLLIALLAGCSEAPSESAAPEQQLENRSPSPSAGRREQPRARLGEKRTRARKQRTNQPAKDANARNGAADPADPGRSGNAAAPAAPAPYPAAGAYRYAQQGFEEYCQQAQCQRYNLPAKQTVNFSYARRSATAATIVSDARISERRSMTTTTRYNADKVLITHVVADFQLQGGFTYSTAYEPDPPVEALRTPLRVGEGWSGRWKDTTSGDYTIRVVGRDRIAVAGRRIAAVRLDTRTNFRGEFSGRADLVVWVDATTRVPVKTIGTLRLSSSYGDFNSDFEVTLASGPGYG